jgi:hypothetical protein
MQVLVVTNPMRGYAIGDRITDPALILEIRASEHSSHVVLADHADVHTAPAIAKEPVSTDEE